MHRKLLFFFDGTSRATLGLLQSKPTNMYRLNQVFTNGKEGEQISFYYSGVGTSGDRLSAYTGRGFDQIVADAYTNLASNFREGDELYLFGFSRGAMAARVLSGFISHPGLLKDDHLSQDFPHAWALYNDYVNSNLSNGQRSEHIHALRSQLLSPRVRFLGVFDSVPGYTKEIRLRTKNLDLEGCVDHAVQILAADDRRTPFFAPMLWSDKLANGQTMEQIWLPGVHGDIGGSSDARFLGNLSLLTMVEHIQKHCPEVELDEGFLRVIWEETFGAEGPKVEVSNECTDAVEQVLRWGRRTFRQPGVPHEFMVKLTGEPIFVRKRKVTRYSPLARISSDGVYTSGYSSEIDAAIRRNRTHHT